MTNKTKKPNLFLIGHMKTSTTALYHHFKKTPDVFVPEIKELSYFAQEFYVERWKHKGEKFLNHFLKDENGYLNYYKSAGDEKILLDASPNYLISEHAAKDIYKFNQDAKIIVIFRAPVRFMRSLHSGMVFDLVEKEKSFIKALELEERRRKKHAFSYLLYREMANYKKHLERFTKIFPNSQIKVMFYEQINKKRGKSFEEISDFLGIEKIPSQNFQKVNANKKLRFGGIVKRIGRIPMFYILIKRIIPRKTFDKLFKIYSKLVYKNVKREELSKNKLETLKKEQKQNVIEFEKFLKDEGLIEKNFNLIKLWDYDNV